MKDMLIRVKHSKCDIHGLAIFEFHHSFTSPMSCIRESQASLSLLFWFLVAIALLVGTDMFEVPQVFSSMGPC